MHRSFLYALLVCAAGACALRHDDDDAAASHAPLAEDVVEDSVHHSAVVPFAELVIVDASVVRGAHASSAANGHWSFRWLMEQMAPIGADPADFAAGWPA